ncbi:jg12687 [Pararge aegeria aegeria]|uniref:Jg12687 protein n=1 Tax=Pararge aegeria aegeria TaxID=348720 RepID=A0A8S4S388_9NEOP|nr:jg12687 [Pararge aegeria aegeria]
MFSKACEVYQSALGQRGELRSSAALPSHSNTESKIMMIPFLIKLCIEIAGILVTNIWESKRFPQVPTLEN